MGCHSSSFTLWVTAPHNSLCLWAQVTVSLLGASDLGVKMAPLALGTASSILFSLPPALTFKWILYYTLFKLPSRNVTSVSCLALGCDVSSLCFSLGLPGLDALYPAMFSSWLPSQAVPHSISSEHYFQDSDSAL